MSIPRIALTGGPCGGKTTLMKKAKDEFGEQVLVMPEVASILLDHGFPKPGKDLDFTQRWLESFQGAVFPVQLNMENEYMQMALGRSTRMLLCDRGLLDGAAYLGKGLQFFLEYFKLDLAEVHARYDAVIHLESIAVSNPDLYLKLKATNPARYESVGEAVNRDAAIKQAWKEHPNWILIPSGQGFKQAQLQMLGILSQYINTEIECKYVLKHYQAFSFSHSVPIKQAYLGNQPEGEIRIRQMGDEYYITIKSEGAHSRQECERSIDQWAFELMWQYTVGRRIEKTRYFVPFGDLTLEVDKFTGQLDGLTTLECEFRTEEELQRFVLPSWVTHAQDVTSHPGFKNKNLALHGIPS